MPLDSFLPYAPVSGLNVTALYFQFGCAYSSAHLLLTEKMPKVPMLLELYERKARGGPAHWPAYPRLGELTVSVVKRSTDFAPSGSPLLCGARGGGPHKCRWLPAGSAADGSLRSGMPEYAGS